MTEQKAFLLERQTVVGADNTSSTTPQPSWRQLAAIPESVLKASVLKACGVTPPCTGISRAFDGGSFRVFANVHPGTQNTEGIWFTLYQGTGTQLFTSPKQLLKALRTSPGTATGDAIRNWFTFFAPKPGSEESSVT
jgi:hypothetical protein